MTNLKDLGLSLSKNQLISANFAHHENGKVVKLIDLASPTVDLKSPGCKSKGKVTPKEGKNMSSRARDDGT